MSGTVLAVRPFEQSVQHYPATATLATVASTAPGAKASVVVRSISANLVAGAAAENRRLVLRDGASGAGTIIWSIPIFAPANVGANPVQLSDLNIQIPTAGNLATLEFDAAGAVGSQQGVSMTYYRTDQIQDSRVFGVLS
jgi:hypothetical protein